MSEKEVETIIRKYISVLGDSGISIDRVFLYGSYVRGEATDSSDMDIMLVSDSKKVVDSESKAFIWGLTRKVDTRIEPLICFSTLKKQLINGPDSRKTSTDLGHPDL